MAKPNYQFEKRQRELAKKRKKEEKAQRKASHQGGGDDASVQEAQPEDGQSAAPEALGDPPPQ